MGDSTCHCRTAELIRHCKRSTWQQSRQPALPVGAVQGMPPPHSCTCTSSTCQWTLHLRACPLAVRVMPLPLQLPLCITQGCFQLIPLVQQSLSAAWHCIFPGIAMPHCSSGGLPASRQPCHLPRACHREHRAPAVARGQLPTHLPLLCEHARQSQDLSQHRCCQACENITEQVRGQDEADGLSIETPQKPTRLLN